MGFLSKLFGVLQYAPLVIEVTRSLSGKQGAPDEQEASQHDLDALRRESEKRFSEIDGEISHLRERIRHMESALVSLQLWVKIGVVSLAIVVVLLLIVVVSHGLR